MPSQQQAINDAPPPYEAVVFDCDSTLSTIEGIDELARLIRERRPEVNLEEVESLTSRAMAGELPIEAVYGKRLELLQPNAKDLAQVGEFYVQTQLPGAQELVRCLQLLSKRVVVISGGLLAPVLHLSCALGIPLEDTHAVPVELDRHGEFLSWGLGGNQDNGRDLAKMGGKPKRLRALGLDQVSCALVGDGSTDRECAPLLSRFVAFGGVAKRERVFAGAVASTESSNFADLAALLLSQAELDELARRSKELPLDSEQDSKFDAFLKRIPKL